MKKKILGTGLTGLVGSRITELLGDQFNFEDLAFEKGFDITQRKTLEAKIADSAAETLIHLAAFTDVNAAWKEKGDRQGKCFQTNVLGTKNIAGLCAQYQKFLIHFSTDFVFDGRKENPYTEEDQPRPIEWYGQTKLWAEEEVQKSGCRFCLVRIAYPFRASYLPKSDLVRKMIVGFKSKSLYPLFADQIITPTLIDDIARGVEQIIFKKAQGIFHLTGASFISPCQLAQKIATIFGFDKDLVKKGSLEKYLIANPSSRPYQKTLALSNKKAQALGIKMRSIDESLWELERQGM